MKSPLVTAEIPVRNPDCIAEVIDPCCPVLNELPVCLGGTAIIGCSNPEKCLQDFKGGWTSEGATFKPEATVDSKSGRVIQIVYVRMPAGASTEIV